MAFGYLDCSFGIAGDMFLGALVGAGLDADVLRERLRALGVPGWDLRVEEVRRGGIAAMRVGGRLSDIGHAVEQAVRAAGDYGVVEEYVGHGIGVEMHMDPQVPNVGRPGRGPRLVEGTVLATNSAMLKFARQLGFRQERIAEDPQTVRVAKAL